MLGMGLKTKYLLLTVSHNITTLNKEVSLPKTEGVYILRNKKWKSWKASRKRVNSLESVEHLTTDF